jgi:hypothetical protein
MSFQTSQDDLSFGPSGERILTSSIKGQIFEFQKTIYILYTEFNNNQYSIIVHNANTQQKYILHTSSEKIVIRTLQFDSTNQKIWFGGYLNSPMRGFISSTTINTQTGVSFSTISSLEIKENTRTIETITIINMTTIIYSAISNLNECLLMSNNSIHRYKINTTLSGILSKEAYIRTQGTTRFYYIFIDGISSITNRSQIEIYKIPINTITGSL